MTLEIVTIPCLRDNYAYVVADVETGEAQLVDAPEAAPILGVLEQRGWALKRILITHHHDDHVAGVAAISKHSKAKVVGAAADLHRLPPTDIAVAGGDVIGEGASQVEVIEVPGHTRGHVAYYFADRGALFSADSLMVMGCGRLFEGTADEMWASLHRLRQLPPETMVYSGHEYATSNVRFALSVDSENPALRARARAIEALRAEGRPTVPARLSEELATNPFLRPGDPALRRHLGMEFAFDAEVFAELRRRKDSF